jgi:hypothetical protein
MNWKIPTGIASSTETVGKHNLVFEFESRYELVCQVVRKANFFSCDYPFDEGFWLSVYSQLASTSRVGEGGRSFQCSPVHYLPATVGERLRDIVYKWRTLCWSGLGDDQHSRATAGGQKETSQGKNCLIRVENVAIHMTIQKNIRCYFCGV